MRLLHEDWKLPITAPAATRACRFDCLFGSSLSLVVQRVRTPVTGLTNHRSASPGSSSYRPSTRRNICGTHVSRSMIQTSKTPISCHKQGLAALDRQRLFATAKGPRVSAGSGAAAAPQKRLSRSPDVRLPHQGDRRRLFVSEDRSTNRVGCRCPDTPASSAGAPPIRRKENGFQRQNPGTEPGTFAVARGSAFSSGRDTRLTACSQDPSLSHSTCDNHAHKVTIGV